MKFFLKTVSIFIVFQLLKIIIFIFQYYIINFLKPNYSEYDILINLILSKYLPVIIVLVLFLSFSLFKKKYDNILPFIFAFVLEAFINDRFLFFFFDRFYLRIVINFFMYSILFIIFNLIYKKYNNTNFMK